MMSTLITRIAPDPTLSSPAIRTAEVLLAASAAFAVTNEPATGQVKIPLPLPRATKSKGYKALVILNMAGGADTFVSIFSNDHYSLLVSYCTAR